MIKALPLLTALEMGAATWDALAAALHFPSVFMSWAWHKAWSETASSEDLAGAHVLTDYTPTSPARPRLLVPLGFRRVRYHRLPVSGLTWCAADLGTPDHLDLIASESCDIAELAEHILAERWHLLTLTNLVAGSTQLPLLFDAMRTRGCHVAIAPLWPCAQIHLPPTWDEYLALLGKKHRYRIRRDERDLRARHSVKLVTYGRGGLEEGLSHLTRLYAARWGSTGAVGATRLTSAYRSFAGALAESGRLWLLGLAVDDQVVAIEMAGEFGGNLFGIQSGWDPVWSKRSVGRVLRGMSVRRAIEHGIRCFDFSRDVDPYKREWCLHERWCYEATIVRNTPTGRLLRGWGEIAHRTRRIRGCQVEAVLPQPVPGVSQGVAHTPP
jgi:CelD/BcsL family acetyltransferase involved in cellulose biosynthesis